MKIEVKKLPRGEYVKGEGAYYAVVDGVPVGHDGRAFWDFRSQAEACGNNYAMAAKTCSPQS